MGLLTASITRSIPHKRMDTFRGMRLTVYATCMLFEEVLAILWERKSDGVASYLMLPFRFGKYVLCALAVFACLGRRAHMSFLLIAWFHRLDDVIDGDSALPYGWSLDRYCRQKQNLIRSLSCGDECADMLYEDLMLVKAFKAARRIGVTISDDVLDVWSVIRWELEKRESRRLPSREELVEQTTVLDRAVLRFAVKAGRGNMTRFHELEGAFNGIFTRTDWLDDVLTDLQSGIVNIPSEAVTVYGVDLARVSACASWEALLQDAPFRKWYRDELTRSASDWSHLRSHLGDDFGGVFSSKFITWIFVRLTVGKLTSQFDHAAARV